MHEESVAVDVSQLTAGANRKTREAHQSPEGECLLITTAMFSDKRKKIWYVRFANNKLLSKCLTNVSREQTHFSVNLSFGKQGGGACYNFFKRFSHTYACYSGNFVKLPFDRTIQKWHIRSSHATILYSFSWHN